MEVGPEDGGHNSFNKIMIYEIEVDILDIKHKTRIKTHCTPRRGPLRGEPQELVSSSKTFPEVIL